MTFLRIGFVVLILFLAARCSRAVEWRQKTTVEVEIDGEIYSSSSVERVRGRVNYDMSQGWAAGLWTRANGEAVIIDLGSHGLLFALLNGDPGSQAYRAVFADRFNRRTRDPSLIKPGAAGVIDDYRTIRADRTRYELTGEELPQFARFDDLSDPLTVQVVTPENIIDIYGETARIRSVVFEITDEPQSPARIRELLPWLSEHPEPLVIPRVPGERRSRSERSPEEQIFHGHFVREMIK